MKSQGLTLLLMASCLILPAKSASIIDLIEWSLSGKEPETREEQDATNEGKRNCLCDGPSCICCVDFNFTIIDLGGPGCVRMKYLSQEEGFAVNVSYGNSLLHSQLVKGPDPEPTCINLLSRVAQLCARLTDLAPTSDGLRGCLQLEPTLFREPQLDFPLGCFRSGPNGMAMEEVKFNSTAEQEEEEESPETPESETDTSNLSTVQIIQAVNESAEEGIAFFSNLLGLAFGKPNSTNTPEEKETPKDPEPPKVSAPQAENSRKSKKMNIIPGPNMI